MLKEKSALRKAIEEYVESHHQETIALLKELAVIPAPSGHEEKRAAFVLQWLHAQGAKDARIDAVGNVVFPYQCEKGKKITVMMAHMDVVCPDLNPLPLQEEGQRFVGPGVRDDTANLVNMLMAAKFLLQNKVAAQEGILFVADVGEEGLGNLKGSRHILESYRERIAQWICFDLNYNTIYTDAVGSRRYCVTVRTKGGHSYHDFGEKNAIAELAALITELYHPNICTPSKFTYNVGQIQGGTSVNTIAQEASMLYEIRSESEETLNQAEQRFYEILEAHRIPEAEIEAEVIGIRPGNGNVDKGKQKKLADYCRAAIAAHYEGEVTCAAGSTDANIPLSAGIPAVTVGTAFGEGTHTRREWLDIDSMRIGQKVALELALGFCGQRKDKKEPD